MSLCILTAEDSLRCGRLKMSEQPLQSRDNRMLTYIPSIICRNSTAICRIRSTRRIPESMSLDIVIILIKMSIFIKIILMHCCPIS